MNRSVFSRQLRYWSFHCSLNALPSFCIALIYLQLWRSPSAFAAMGCAVGLFILVYAILTSLSGPLGDENHVISRALRLGVKIRAVISGISLFAVPTGVGIIISPDLWCGAIAVGLMNEAGRRLAGRSNAFFNFDDGEGMRFSSDFLPVFATTLLEGFILSFLLLMISFFAVAFLQARERRNAFRALDPNRENSI